MSQLSTFLLAQQETYKQVQLIIQQVLFQFYQAQTMSYLQNIIGCGMTQTKRTYQELMIAYRLKLKRHQLTLLICVVVLQWKIGRVGKSNKEQHRLVTKNLDIFCQPPQLKTIQLLQAH